MDVVGFGFVFIVVVVVVVSAGFGFLPPVVLVRCPSSFCCFCFCCFCFCFCRCCCSCWVLLFGWSSEVTVVPWSARLLGIFFATTTDSDSPFSNPFFSCTVSEWVANIRVVDDDDDRRLTIATMAAVTNRAMLFGHLWLLCLVVVV